MSLELKIISLEELSAGESGEVSRFLTRSEDGLTLEERLELGRARG